MTFNGARDPAVTSQGSPGEGNRCHRPFFMRIFMYQSLSSRLTSTVCFQKIFIFPSCKDISRGNLVWPAEEEKGQKHHLCFLLFYQCGVKKYSSPVYPLIWNVKRILQGCKDLLYLRIVCRFFFPPRFLIYIKRKNKLSYCIPLFEALSFLSLALKVNRNRRGFSVNTGNTGRG